MLLAYCIYAFYSAPGYGRYRKLIVGLILLDLAVVAVRTWSALDVNPEISRYLATGKHPRHNHCRDGRHLGGRRLSTGLCPSGDHARVPASSHHRQAVQGGVVGRCVDRHRPSDQMSFTIAVIMWVAFGLCFLAGETFGRRNQRVVVVGDWS